MSLEVSYARSDSPSMTVFKEVYADRYDGLYAGKDYGGECTLIQEAVRRYASGAVNLLDVGCGTGTHSIELARRGYSVVGVDFSREMLDQAVSKASFLPEPIRPQFQLGDARNFDTGKLHDVCIMMFAVLGYMTTNDDILSSLRTIRRQLRQGAVLVFDFWYGPAVLAQQPGERVRVVPCPDGRVIRAASTTLDSYHHTADVTFRLWALRGDRLADETEETHRMRYFFPQEIALFLTAAGFALKKLTAFPSLDSPPSSETWNVLGVALAV